MVPVLRFFSRLSKSAMLAGIVAFGAHSSSLGAETETAILAGGCFWCIEKDFEHVKGVADVVSGYSGGETENPTYRNHSRGKHLEVVKITYDPDVLPYPELLKIFWRSIDPTDAGGQFCDRGHSYTTAVFALDENQKRIAMQSKKELEASGVLKAPIVTPVRDAAPFYLAEDYHQDFYKKSPSRYGYYRSGCGRDNRVKALWGDEAHYGINKDKNS